MAEDSGKNPWVGRVVYGGVVVAIGIVIFFWYFFFTSVVPGSLDGARVRTDGTVLELQNGSGMDWAQVEVILNRGFQCGVVPRIAEGDSHSLPLRDCADSRGVRFNPASMKPQQVELRVLSSGRVFERTLTF